MAATKKKHKKRRRLIIHPRFFLVVALLVVALGVLILLLVALFSGNPAPEAGAPIQTTEGQKKGSIFQIFAKETPTPPPPPTPPPRPPPAPRRPPAPRLRRPRRPSPRLIMWTTATPAATATCSIWR